MKGWSRPATSSTFPVCERCGFDGQRLDFFFFFFLGWWIGFFSPPLNPTTFILPAANLNNLDDVTVASNDGAVFRNPTSGTPGRDHDLAAKRVVDHLPGFFLSDMSDHMHHYTASGAAGSSTATGATRPTPTVTAGRAPTRAGRTINSRIKPARRIRDRYVCNRGKRATW